MHENNILPVACSGTHSICQKTAYSPQCDIYLKTAEPWCNILIESTILFSSVININP